MFSRAIPLILVALSALSISPASAGQREIPSTAMSIADDIVASSKRTVAVVDFTDLQGNVTELGRFVAEEMALGLVTARKGLSVVDRTHLKVLMQENKLDATGVIDPATARKIGQILGVEALVTGTITPFADTVRIVVKVLDTTTARIVAAASADMSKNRTLEELLARDIRTGPTTVTSSTSASPSSSASAAASRGPVFQGGPVRVTVGQLGVSKDNGRAGVSLNVENVSREPIYLALNGAYNGGRASVSLADDQGSDWNLAELSGISKLSPGSTSDKENAFTVIQPAERIVVVMNFSHVSRGAETPAKVFSVSASATYFTPTGHRGLSIGLAGITSPAAER